MRILRRRKKGEVKPACGRRPTSVYGSLPLPTYGASWFALEPRIMFDGAGVATLGTVATEPLAQSQAEALSLPEDVTAGDALPDPAPTGEPQFNSNDQALFDALAAYDTSAARQEIVFLSPSVRDYQQLLDGISPNVEVFVLDPARDGVEQMAKVLVGRTGIDAIHLIGEGTEAEMHLGSSFLTQESISTRYAEQFQQIGQSLSEKADLLIYGCKFGQGEAGLGAMKTLAELTGADIAASTDRTGHVSEYANWDLEVSVGFIETSIVIGEATQEAWEGVLATYTVTTTTDGGAGSLRQAILNANANSGTDTITFVGNGTYLLTIGGTGENSAVTGDLDITESVAITGNGVGNTIIDGGGIDRIFDVRSSSVVTISGLTIQGGSATGGGGIHVDSGTNVTLSNVIVSGNTTSDDGGGIFNQGTLTLTDTTISGNSAVWGGGINNSNVMILDRVTIDANMSSNNGGGIYNDFANGATLTNVTISGNTSGGNGGGIFTNSSINITNSTIASNLGGGGIHEIGSGNAILKNTILDNNTGGNANRALTSLGNNIDSDSTAGLGDPLDGMNPLLGALADNGGPTKTHALLAGSPALNAGTATGAPAVDQRGIVRDGAPDIGAYEYKVSAFVSKNEFRINDPSGNNEVTSGPVRGAERAVDIAPNGDYVVVWTNGTSNDKVFAKVLDSGGNEKVAQFQVNIGGGNNEWADVTVDDSGNFVVAWNQSGDIYMRRFLANGTAVDAGDVIVNTGTSNTQQNPSVNMNGAGDFVIAWEGDGSGTEGIFIRRGSVGGGLIGSDITVNTAAAAQDPSVGIDDSGNFVVVWDNGSDVFFQLYNSAGVPQNSGQVDVFLQFSAGAAAVDMSGDGRFTVAYRATLLSVDVYARQFDAAGNALFLPKIVNTSFLGTQTNPSVTMDDIGEFLVVWEGAGDRPGQNDTAGIFGQKFNSSGQKIGVEFLINQTTANVQDRASVAMLDRDNFVAVWTGSDGAQTDVFARQYGATTSPTLDLDANDSSGILGNDYAFTFTEGDGPTAIADADTDLADVDSTTFAYVTLSVSGLLDGNAEVLILDGDTFALATDAPGQDTTGGNYHVALATGTGTAIMTIIKQSGATFSEIEAETLIKAIRYQHTDTSAPTDGDRLIEVRVNDGTTDSAAARTTINVNLVNDAPVVSAPGAALSATEQVGLAIHGTGFGVSDIDAGGGSATAALNVGEGTLTVVAGTSGVTIVGGNGTGTVTLSGTIAQINNLLSGGGTGTITYLNGLDVPSASTTVTVTVNDQGNTGTDPGLTGTGTTEEGTNSVTINLSAVNDDPTNVGSLPTDITVTEDVLSNVDLSLIDLSDVDAGGGNLTVTLTTATGGNLTAVSGGGVTVAGSGTGVLTLTGTQANLNTYLNSAANVQYLHGTVNTNGNNADTITVQVSDNGNTGSGGGGTLSLGTVNMDITAQNDAPMVAANTGSTVVWGGTDPITNGELQVADLDNSPAQLAYTVTVGPVNGQLELTTFPGVAITTFTQADINAGRLVFVHNGAVSLMDSFTFTVSDGAGGTIGSTTFTFTVSPVIQPPLVIPPSLVPQPPAPPSGTGPPPAGSPPLPSVVVPAPVSPKPNSEGSFVPALPGNEPRSTAPLPSEVPGAPHPKGINTPTSSIQLMREVRGNMAEVVAPRMYQADKEVPKAFGGQTLEKSSTGLSEAFRTSLGVVEEDLRRATDMSESSLKFAVGVTNLGGVSLTAGVIAWLLRSGALLASLAATLPAWRHFDPLPVVLTSERTRRRSTEDTVVAADRENKQFRGLRDLLDKKGDKGRSEGEGREG